MGAYSIEKTFEPQPEQVNDDDNGKFETMKKTTKYYKVRAFSIKDFSEFLKELKEYTDKIKVFSAGIGEEYLIVTGDYDEQAAMHPMTSVTDFDDIITRSKKIISYKRLDSKPTPEQRYSGKWVSADERINHIEEVLKDDNDGEEQEQAIETSDKSDFLQKKIIAYKKLVPIVSADKKEFLQKKIKAFELLVSIKNKQVEQPAEKNNELPDKVKDIPVSVGDIWVNEYADTAEREWNDELRAAQRVLEQFDGCQVEMEYKGNTGDEYFNRNIEDKKTGIIRVEYLYSEFPYYNYKTIMFFEGKKTTKYKTLSINAANGAMVVPKSIKVLKTGLINRDYPVNYISEIEELLNDVLKKMDNCEYESDYDVLKAFELKAKYYADKIMNGNVQTDIDNLKGFLDVFNKKRHIYSRYCAAKSGKYAQKIQNNEMSAERVIEILKSDGIDIPEDVLIEHKKEQELTQKNKYDEILMKRITTYDVSNYIDEPLFVTFNVRDRHAKINSLNSLKRKGYNVEELGENGIKVIKDKEQISEQQPQPEKTYLDQVTETAVNNLKIISRTTKGVVDTSASDKKSEIFKNKESSNVADIALQNFKDTIKFLYNNKDTDFHHFSDLLTFVNVVNKKINSGIVKDGTLMRTQDSAKLPYTSIENLRDAHKQFIEEFFNRLYSRKYNAVETAAWLHWRINFTDHFFADGCSKTSEALAIWVLMRADMPIYKYKNEPNFRKEFYNFASKEVKDINNLPSYYRTDYKKWVEYFKTLFNN
jgi:hypothetical protein